MAGRSDLIGIKMGIIRDRNEGSREEKRLIYILLDKFMWLSSWGRGWEEVLTVFCSTTSCR